MHETATDHLEAFRKHIEVERGLAANTCKSYCYQVGQYLAFLSHRNTAVSAANREDIVAWLEEKKNAGQRSASLFCAAMALRQFHRFLAASGRTAADPTAGMKLPKLRQRLPTPLSKDEMRHLLDRSWGYQFQHVRNQAMLELLYATGMRVSELIGLKIEAVNLTEGWVRILGKGGKERTVPVGPRATAVILRYLEAKLGRFPAAGGALFVSIRGRPLGRGAFWLMLKKVAVSVGLPGMFPHRVRHSTATHLLFGGASLKAIQEILGHASIVTTQRYAHVSNDLLKQTCRKAHPRY